MYSIIKFCCCFFQTGKTKKKAGKKTLAGASAKAGRKDDFLDYDNQYDDYDDFMWTHVTIL